MKLNHDTMICEKPKSTLKNNFSPSFHVLYTSVFLFWDLNKPQSNRVNAFFCFIWKNLLSFTLREKKSAQADKSCQSYGYSKTTKGSKNFKAYQYWICLGREKLRGTSVTFDCDFVDMNIDWKSWIVFWGVIFHYSVFHSVFIWLKMESLSNEPDNLILWAELS